MAEEVIHVFLVDDDEDDYALTRDLLAEAEGACFELEDVDTLMKNADIAMYRAKEQGRDNVQRYTGT